MACRMSLFGVFVAAVQHQPHRAEVLRGKRGQKLYTSGLIVTYTNIYYTLKQWAFSPFCTCEHWLGSTFGAVNSLRLMSGLNVCPLNTLK